MDRILLDAGSSGPEGWSTSQRVIRCMRQWRLARDGFQGEDRDPLIKGSLVHLGVAHYYARLQAVQQGWTDGPDGKTPGPDAYYTPSEAIALLGERQLGTEHVALSQRVVGAYAREHDAFPPRVIAVERLVRFTVPRVLPGAGPIRDAVAAALPSEIVHTMRIDLITQAPDGRFVVQDHKTQGSPRAAGTAAFDLSGQIIALQWWGQRTFGAQYGGVLIGKINLTTERFEAVAPAIAPHAVAEWPKTRTYIEILKALGTQVYGTGLGWPMALSEQGPCLDRYGPCGFRDSCRLGLPFVEGREDREREVPP